MHPETSSLLEHMSEGWAYCRMIFDGDVPRDFVYLAVNPAFRQLTGLGDVVGRKVSEVVPGIVESDPGLMEFYARVSRGGGPARTEIYVAALESWFTVSAFSPQPDHFVALFDVVNRRKRTEQALLATNERLESLLRTSPLAIIEWTTSDFRVTYWSDEATRMFGWTAEEVVGRRIDEIEWVHAEDWPGVEAVMQDMLSGQRPRNVNRNRNVRKDGGVIHCEWHNSARHDPGGGFSVLSIVRDVTEARLAEEALREAAQRLETALHYAKAGTWDWHIDANRIVWSDELFVLFGLDPRRTASSFEAWRSALHPDDIADAEARIVRALEDHAPLESDYRVILPGGVVRWINAVGHGIYDAAGRPIRMTGLCIDITGRKNAELALAEREAELVQARKMESIGRLAGGVAHDFNNSLGIIIGYSELALEQMDPSLPLYADLSAILAAAEKSASLTTQLLTFARKQPIVPRVLDLNGAIEATLAMLRQLIGEDIRLVWEPGPGPWSICMDPSQLDQILTNLCVNARDAIAGVGTLTIGTASRTVDVRGARDPAATRVEHVLITVSDDGAGMDEDTKARIFEPFFTTKADGQGTGLGLATVFGIVEQNGGHIRVSSEPGHGTTFEIFLPMHAGKSDAQPTRTTPDLPGGSETLLLIEDEPALLKTTSMLLGRLGYTVLAAMTPAEAEALAREHAGVIRLLVTDVVMPEMNGLDLARRLVTLVPGLRVLFLSGYTADIIAARGVLEEGVNFLQKPCGRAMLAKVVRTVLDGSPRPLP